MKLYSKVYSFFPLLIQISCLTEGQLVVKMQLCNVVVTPAYLPGAMTPLLSHRERTRNGIYEEYYNNVTHVTLIHYYIKNIKNNDKILSN